MNVLEKTREEAMVHNCCVVGCTNNSGKKMGVSFHRLPTDKERYNKWMAAVRRDDWKPTIHTRICSKHFESGKPHSHPDHPDYVPSIFPDVYRKSKPDKTLKRVDRWMKRRMTQIERQEQLQIQRLKEEEEKKCEEKKKAIMRKEEQQKKRLMELKEKEREKEMEKQRFLEEVEKLNQELEEERRKQEREKREKEQREIEEQENIKRQQMEEKEKEERRKCFIRERNSGIDKEQEEIEENISCLKKEWVQLEEEKCRLNGQDFGERPFYSSTTKHAEQQTDTDCSTVEEIIQENEMLKQVLKSRILNVDVIKGDDAKTLFFTGLKSWAVFMHLHMFLSPYVSSSALTSENELLMVLVRLRLGLLLEDVAHRFGVSTSVVSRVFQKWLEVLYFRLKFLIKWPSREVARTNMPPSFKELYPHCICIIDCSEIYIETPVFFEARSKTYSNYKKHNTIKFLIGITPCGSICFLSKCWGGRASDKIITQQSGLFNHLLPGDVVLADRGFTLSDDFSVYGAKLVIPTFTRGKNQLPQMDVETSKQLSNVRIHVERVIGHMKKKFRILRGPLPITVLKHAKDIEASNIDKILHTCAALTNLSNSVVV